MSIYRSDEYRRLERNFRLQPVDQADSEEKRDQKDKKKVSYQGRSWSEQEEDLPMQPSLVPPLEKPKPKGDSGIYAGRELLEKADRILKRFVTLEEKIAQLCFYQTEAYYDADIQSIAEALIQKNEVGGILFTKGEFRRQSYLIERYQSLSKMPLLIGNDFFHGLSFYFQGKLPLELLGEMNERRYGDLGRTVVSQNRHLGVHFQFDQERENKHSFAEKKEFLMEETQAKAFRNGIREARGIVGRERKKKAAEVSHALRRPRLQTPLIQNLIMNRAQPDQVQEAFALRVIHFFDLSLFDESTLTTNLLEAFQVPYDALLIKERGEEIIAMIASFVKKGLIKEEEVDRRLMKVLLIKMLFFSFE